MDSAWQLGHHTRLHDTTVSYAAGILSIDMTSTRCTPFLRRFIARKLDAGTLAKLPCRTQLGLLDGQPAIDRVIRVDIRRIPNLCHPELEGRINAHSFRFDQPLSGWDDTGESHHLVRELGADVPPDQTQEYALLMRLIGGGGRPKGITSRQGVLDYIGGVQRLIDDIRRDGIREPHERDRGIQVCIDENGRLCKVWGGGTHRYGIAREFGLEDVPVYVRNAHRRWLDRAVSERDAGPLRAVEQAIRALGA